MIELDKCIAFGCKEEGVQYEYYTPKLPPVDPKGIHKVLNHLTFCYCKNHVQEPHKLLLKMGLIPLTVLTYKKQE